jgi:hypothetical protein
LRSLEVFYFKNLPASRWSLNPKPFRGKFIFTGQIERSAKMKIRSLAMASVFVLSLVSAHAQFASSVIDYHPGTGFAAGFTNTSAALGAPASGSSVSPFSPPYAKTQLVSIGTNGWITLRFDTPIIKNPSNPFGVDFSIFGNTFFAITNGNYSGGGITSGSIGGNNTGATTVQVSADGTNWFTLNPALAPTADNIFPTDGLGDPRVPVNPALTANSFAGLGLTGIRALYAGSAGGTGYDLAWAQDTNGNYLDLPIARYVRVNVLSNKSEIDAVAAVRGTLPVLADDFYTDPLANGWQVFGNTNLFHWNATNQNIEVTWDSTNVNSYLYHPLGTVLTRDDNFSIAFDLQLSDAEASGYGFELAVGLLNLSEATSTNFDRSTGYNSPNLVEFDYFPDAGYGATVWPLFVDTNSNFNYNGSSDYVIYAPTPGDWYHVVMTYTAASQTMVTTMTNFEQTSGITIVDPLNSSFSDFRVDTLSISSYRDDGFGDSILAHGTVDNFVVSLPPPPVQNITGNFSGGQWRAQFNSRSNWLYTLQRTADFQTWTDAASTTATGTNVLIVDPNPPVDKGFYRIKAERP